MLSFTSLWGVQFKKPDQIREVFDSSAVFQDISSNSVSLSVPDLVGILRRSLENAVGISGGIRQMFYAFHVLKKHRDYLRFF